MGGTKIESMRVYDGARVEDFERELQAAKRVAKRHDIAVFMISKTDSGFSERYTAAFKPHLIADVEGPVRTPDGLADQ